jgi:hypothetical protein
MANITFTIADNKLQRVREGMLEVFPNTERDENDDPRYTDNEWLKEKIRRFVVHNVKRGESAIAQDAAKQALEETDSLIT